VWIYPCRWLALWRFISTLPKDQTKIRVCNSSLLKKGSILLSKIQNGSVSSPIVGDMPKVLHDSKRISKGVIKIASTSSEAIVEALHRNPSKSLRSQRQFREQFENRLLERWQKPIDLLEILVAFCLQAGASLKYSTKSGQTRSPSDDFLFYVLRNLHARGCQVANEILSLLKAGFADGAHARWRTLYEIAVISCFIKNHGQESAKRYLQYESVENYKEMLEYQRHYSELGYEPIPEKTIKGLSDAYQDIIKRYGRAFGRPYGWIPENTLKDRSFAGIEKSEHFDKLRPYYILACHNVHSGPKAIRFRLGIFRGGRHRAVVLAGASNYGLADPGQGAAISLSQITTCFLSTRPTIRNLTSMMVTLRLVDEIRTAFVEVQNQIEREEQAAVTQSNSR